MGAEITTLTDRQVPAAAATLARAFHDDPLMVYAIPDAAERARLLPEMYARMVRFGLLAGEVLATTGAPDGVALWLPPNAKWTRENMQAAGMHETPMLIGDDAYQRYREVVTREWQARERDMKGPCWYLFLIGVEPSRQRRGVGAAMIRPMLERADKGKQACYLETENQRNVAFYEKQGFDTIVNGEEAGGSGVRFWTFRRLPKR
ncbi:MAG TPA: GNAT family N-acetyltransferase [Patescibacteria group bacterium]|nr:GNAT family N-acetyltransferase [Patescibacteria group bacterium]